MQIDERPSGDVMILDVRGKLTIGEGDELLKDKINSLIQQGTRSSSSISKVFPTSIVRGSER